MSTNTQPDLPGRHYGRRTVFAAPTLIAHYVRDHRYRPPTLFLDALIAFRRDTADLALGWIPSSPEHEDLTTSPKP